MVNRLTLEEFFGPCPRPTHTTGGSRVAQSGAEGKLGSHPVQAWPFTRGKIEARRGKIEGLLFPRELVAEQELELRSPESRSSSTGS